MINTQVARMSEFRAAATAESGEPLPGSDVNEELHIFTLNDVSIRQGERIVVPVGRWKVPRSDAFSLVLSSRPPQEIWRQFNNEQQARLARLMKRPQVDRLAILNNTTDAPFTTAPALFIEAGRVMGQGTMTYTPVGGSVEVVVNRAVDISVAHVEEETSRIPNARTWGSTVFDQVSLHGTIELTNRRDKPIDIRVRRELIGVADNVDLDGKTVRQGLTEHSGGPASIWWQWYSWPSWWTHLNTRSDVIWNFTLGAGKSQQLGYDWHYYWRP
jgi:hypothetical protein